LIRVCLLLCGLYWTEGTFLKIPYYVLILLKKTPIPLSIEESYSPPSPSPPSFFTHPPALLPSSPYTLPDPLVISKDPEKYPPTNLSNYV
jgi:hypothetical protein